MSWNAATLHGETRRLVLVGLAPARTSPPGSPALAPGARTGERLEDLLGRPVAEIASTTNVLPRHDHPVRGAAALRLGAELRELLERERVVRTVILGMDAARLMGLRHGAVRSSVWFTWEWDHRPGGLYYAVAPHPSGRSRYWNEPENRERARAFFADLARGETR